MEWSVPGVAALSVAVQREVGGASRDLILARIRDFALASVAVIMINIKAVVDVEQ